MRVSFAAYDTDLHRYMTDDEVRIAPSGQIYYANTPGDWQPLAETAEWIVIKSIGVKPLPGVAGEEKQ